MANHYSLTSLIKFEDFIVEDDFEKHREEVEKLLLGFKVRFTYKQRRPYKVVGVTSNNVYHETKTISLVEYYKKKYDVDVVHHDLPGVVPFELFTVSEKQSTLYAQMHGLHI